jgi:hypothetical protein
MLRARIIERDMQDQRRRVKAAGVPPRGLGFLIAAVLAVNAAAPVVASAQQPSLLLSPEEMPGVSLPSPAGPLLYVPGRGLRVGETGLAIGGYSTVNLVRDEGAAAQLTLDDLSFFVIWDPTARVHLFSELEFEDLIEVDDHGRGGTPDNTFTVERLYGDLGISDLLNVRAGKFLTPVGRWNVIHAQPLVWTTSRPLATSLPFDPHVTGAMLFGSVFPDSSELRYSLYGQFVDQFERVSQPQPADRSAGARLEYGLRGAAVGTSFFTFTHQSIWQQVIGLDTLLVRGPLEVMGEFVFADATRDLGIQWGLYLQSVIEVLPRFHLVGRYEHFEQRPPQPGVNIVDLGVAYKPAPPIIVKAEYLIADHRAEQSPPGFKCSVAILF